MGSRAALAKDAKASAQCHGGEWALLCSLEIGQPRVADSVELRAAGLSSVHPELSQDSLSSLVQWEHLILIPQGIWVAHEGI